MLVVVRVARVVGMGCMSVGLVVGLRIFGCVRRRVVVGWLIGWLLVAVAVVVVRVVILRLVLRRLVVRVVVARR